MKFRSLLPALCLSALFLARPGHAGIGVNTMGEMTGALSLSADPILRVDRFDPFGASVDLRVRVGFTEWFDVIANASTLRVGSNAGWGGFWLMPRVDFGGSNMLGLQVELLGSNLQITPQFNSMQDPQGLFAWEFDLRLPLSANGIGLQAIVVPAFQLGDTGLSGFVEGDMKIGVLPTSRFSLFLRPGVSLDLFDNALRFSACADGIGMDNGPFGVNLGLMVRGQVTVHLGSKKPAIQQKTGRGGQPAARAAAEDEGNGEAKSANSAAGKKKPAAPAKKKENAAPAEE